VTVWRAVTTGSGLFRSGYRRASAPWTVPISPNRASAVAATTRLPAGNPLTAGPIQPASRARSSHGARHGDPEHPPGSQNPMRRRRRTKVVATLGPASSDRTVMGRLFAAGADVFRINMSHTTHEKMRELVATIRAVEAEWGFGRSASSSICRDRQLRLGSFKNDWAEIDNRPGFHPGHQSGAGRRNAPCTPAASGNLHRHQAGDSLLIDDGKAAPGGDEAEPQRIVARVKVAQNSQPQGVSLPETVVPLRH